MNQKSIRNSYNELLHKFGEINDINSAVSLMHWDQEVYMPPKAAQGRGQQLATLSALAHRMFTDQEIGNLLQTLSKSSNELSPDEAKNVSETLYDYDRATKLPEEFVHEFSLVQSQAYEAWVKARQDSDFSTFEPHLQKVVELNKRKADYMGYENSPYDALLEEFERGLTAKTVRQVFDHLAKEQSQLVDSIVNSPNQPNTTWLEQEWDEDVQLDFTVQVLKDMGYDFEAGRQDKSVHPFTINFDLKDVRITTRVNKHELFSALSSSIHEGGHALYEQGFLASDNRTTLGNAISLGIHESQSRMWENIIGRSLPFWKHYGPVLRERFPEQLKDITEEQIYQAANQVQPSFIRVEADECTYNLHIILRFEIELGLIEGDIKVHDVPEVWNAKMKEYLGLDVPSNDLGCLQDIHWSHGAMGYFPTYALGNLYAAMMFERIENDLPNLWNDVEKGNFKDLLGWLRTHVHEVGRRKTAPELMTDLCSEALNAEPYLRYLKKKYGELYSIP